MRICCFWCFGEEEECNNKGNFDKGVKFGSNMSGGILENVIEGGEGDDMENDESEGFGVGLKSLGNGGDEGLGLESEVVGDVKGDDGREDEGLVNMGNGDEGDVRDGNSLCFDQLESGSCGEMSEVNLQLGLGDEPSSSSSVLLGASLDRENCDRDLQNKRPKVQPFSL